MNQKQMRLDFPKHGFQH